MSTASLIELLEAGVHFGHQTQHWNPKMKPYIYGARNGIYILDLRKTTGLLDAAYDAVREYAAKGITANAIAPGIIETDMTRKMPDSAREFILNQVPAGKIGEPEDVAKAVLFFASDAAKYITGQVLAVDGGLTMC